MGGQICERPESSSPGHHEVKSSYPPHHSTTCPAVQQVAATNARPSAQPFGGSENIGGRPATARSVPDAGSSAIPTPSAAQHLTRRAASTSPPSAAARLPSRGSSYSSE